MNNTQNKTANKGLNSFAIRCIAITAMLISFACSEDFGYFEHQSIEKSMYWIAYTLFAFLLSEGVHRTSNRRLYIERFAVFTVISEIAYDYLHYGKLFSLESQSIMVTLFCILLAMMILNYFKRRFNNLILNLFLIIGLSWLLLFVGEQMNFEFYRNAVIIAMLFYISYGISYPKAFQLPCLLFYGRYYGVSNMLSFHLNGELQSMSLVWFVFAALIIIWFYNTERGANSVGIKILFYMIYPLCLIILILFKYFL